MKTIVAIVIALALVGCEEKETFYVHPSSGIAMDIPPEGSTVLYRAARADKQVEYCLSQGHSIDACWLAASSCIAGCMQ